jgi:hypothetical protein
MRDHSDRSSKRKRTEPSRKKLKRKRKHPFSKDVTIQDEPRASDGPLAVTVHQQIPPVHSREKEESPLVQSGSEAQNKLAAAAAAAAARPDVAAAGVITQASEASIQSSKENHERGRKDMDENTLSGTIVTNSAATQNMDENEDPSGAPKGSVEEQVSKGPQHNPDFAAVDAQNASTTTALQSKRSRPPRQDCRIAKRNSAPSTRAAPANGSLNSDKMVARAIGILQWACEQEKENIEQEKNKAIESFRQKALEADISAAVHTREAEVLRKNNNDLRSSLERSTVKLDKLTKHFGKISLFTTGLVNDLDREKRLFDRAKEDVKVLQNDMTGMKSEIVSYVGQISKAKDEIQVMKSKFAVKITELQAKQELYKAETEGLRSQLSDKEALLAKEKETIEALQHTSTEQQALQNRVEALLNTNKDDLLDKLGEIVSEHNRNTQDEEEVLKLKSLLQEIHSRHSITPNDIKNVQNVLSDLQEK